MTDERGAGSETNPGGVVVPERPTNLLNREQAILAFNRRVLAQAERADVPLLERLRYITIVSSNLDEFFEVRFADYLEVVRASHDAASQRDMHDLSAATHALIDAQYRLFNEQVRPALAAAGIEIINHVHRNAAQQRWVGKFFESQVRPLLVPVGLDPAHPFPLVANKSLNFIVRLGGRDAFGRENRIAIVKVPRALPRVIRLPDALCKAGRQGFVLLSSMIRAHLASLFPGRTVEAFSQFRVTRDSDLDVDEDDFTNLRQALRSGLTTRHFGQATRLEVVNTCPPEMWGLLLEQFGLPEAALFRVNGPVNLVRLAQLIDQADADPTDASRRVALRFASYEPAWPHDQLVRGESIIARLAHRGDLLLHHPYESFDPVRGLPARGRARPAGAGHQADHLPHRQRQRADGTADRRGAARQGSDGGGRAEGALRRGGQHQLGRTARGRGRAGGLRHRRPEDARQAAAGDAARRREVSPLRASVDRQLQPAHGAAVYRHRLLHRRCRDHRRCRGGIPATGQPDQGPRTAAPADGAVRAAPAHGGVGGRCGRGGTQPATRPRRGSCSSSTH